MKSLERKYETWLVVLEVCWEECGEDCWFDEGVFYTFVRPALAECKRYSCKISGVCKSSWLTHESSDDG